MAVLLVLFALVILTALFAASAGLRERGASELSLAVRQARAEAATQAALEWAAWRVRSLSDSACGPDPWPLALPDTLAEFALSVTCQRTPARSAPIPYFEEGTQQRVVYELSVQLRAASDDPLQRIERRQTLRLERCQDPAAILGVTDCAD